MTEERELAILKYIRDHDGATATAIASDVLGGPRTTFGRPLKLRRASTELQTLVERGLLSKSQGARQTTYLLTEPGRQKLRDTALGPNLSA
jgi:predicted transcriptional regulator